MALKKNKPIEPGQHSGSKIEQIIKVRTGSWLTPSVFWWSLKYFTKLTNSIFRKSPYKTIETVIKIAILGVLVLWTFQLIKPFLVPILWGIILAVAIDPFIGRFAKILGEKDPWQQFFLLLWLLPYWLFQPCSLSCPPLIRFRLWQNDAGQDIGDSPATLNHCRPTLCRRYPAPGLATAVKRLSK